MTENNPNKLKLRNKYSSEFKERALELAKLHGVSKAAKDLGIADSMLYSWRSQKLQTGQPFEQQKLIQAEIARLKREVNRLAMENEFLKKAAAFFAKESD